VNHQFKYSEINNLSCNSYQRNKLLVHFVIEPAHEHLAYAPTRTISNNHFVSKITKYLLVINFLKLLKWKFE